MSLSTHAYYNLGRITEAYMMETISSGTPYGWGVEKLWLL